MQLNDTDETFGLVSISFHWLLVVFIIAMISMGIYLEELERGPEKFELIGIQKSIGAIILILVALRVIWRLFQRFPEPAGTPRDWEHKLARAWHILVLAVIFVVPLSGYVSSSSGGYPVSVFGLFNLPAIAPVDKSLHEIAEEVHEFTGILLIPLIMLHAAASLKHHYWDKDTTLRRMVGLSEA